MPSRIATLDLRQSTEALLRATFFDTWPIAAGEDLGTRVEAARPDLILLDLRGANGPAPDTIKAAPALAELPLVVIVADGDPALRQAAFAAGADEVLSEPREIALLPTRAAGLIRAHGRLTDLSLHAGTASSLGLVSSEDDCPGTGDRVLILAGRKSRAALERSLRKALGPRVRSAASPAEAEAALGAAPVDAILADGRDDPAGTVRAIAMLSAERRHRSMRTILLLAPDQLATARRALEIGIVDAVAANAAPAEIAQRIRLQIRQKRASDRFRDLAMQSGKLAATDCLTGLHNRRYAQCHIERMVARGAAKGQPLALLTIDLDGLKAINDRHGHAAGDQVLRVVAERLSEGVRDADLLARCGGDEFVVAMPGIGTTAARTVARRLRARVCRRPAGLADAPDLRPGISIGLAVLASGESVEALARRSDQSLYAAKAAGRATVHGGDATSRDLPALADAPC